MLLSKTPVIFAAYLRECHSRRGVIKPEESEVFNNVDAAQERTRAKQIIETTKGHNFSTLVFVSQNNPRWRCVVNVNRLIRKSGRRESITGPQIFFFGRDASIRVGRDDYGKVMKHTGENAWKIYRPNPSGKRRGETWTSANLWLPRQLIEHWGDKLIAEKQIHSVAVSIPHEEFSALSTTAAREMFLRRLEDTIDYLSGRMNKSYYRLQFSRPADDPYERFVKASSPHADFVQKMLETGDVQELAKLIRIKHGTSMEFAEEHAARLNAALGRSSKAVEALQKISEDLGKQRKQAEEYHSRRFRKQ